MRHDLIDPQLTEETVNGLRAVWERWSAALPGDAEALPPAAAYLRANRGGESALVDQLDTVLGVLSTTGHFVPWDLVVADLSGGYRRNPRPMLVKLVNAAGSDGVAMIGVSDLTRLGRDLHDVLRLIDRLFAAGADVSWPHFPSLRSDRLQYAILRGASEWFSAARLNEPRQRSGRSPRTA